MRSVQECGRVFIGASLCRLPILCASRLGEVSVTLSENLDPGSVGREYLRKGLVGGSRRMAQNGTAAVNFAPAARGVIGLVFYSADADDATPMIYLQSERLVG